MSKMLLQVDFPFNGPWGDIIAETLIPFAKDVAAEPGLLWKIWTENQLEKRAGGIHLFASEEALSCFMEKQAARLALLGITEYRMKTFNVSGPLSEVTRAPLNSVMRGNNNPCRSTEY